MGSKRKQRIARMITEIEAVIASARELEDEHSEALALVHPAYLKSARNLVHYRAMRKHDLRKLQKQLGHLGLSRLSTSEAHVMANLLMTRSVLQGFGKSKKLRVKKADVTFKQAPKLLRASAKALLGRRSLGRRVRIMVTLPSEAADDGGVLVHDLLQAGMNSVRINCAHDGPEAWARMVDHVLAAQSRVRRKCRICMDLGGPKIRTGPLVSGPRVVHFRPERDELGRVTHPALVWLGTQASCPREEADACLPLPPEWIKRVGRGDVLRFVDTRGKQRKLTVTEITEDGCWAQCLSASYVMTGTVLHLGEETEGVPVGALPPIERRIVLEPGDTLVLHQDPEPGAPARFDECGALIEPAHVSVTAPEVFGRVRAGEHVVFDDGKIRGIIDDATPGELRVRITQARAGSARLRADKGVNFPDSDLRIRGLTEKDRNDLVFVAEHADAVDMSFVESPQDVEDLQAEITRLGASDRLGIILKIETQRGFDRLTEILLTAMRTYPIGVMIARGDLAVECGWENMARIQDEIMGLCEAAHIPDIWATQVLETMAKKGLPSRAEITDAATAQRAECVMLNKGPHILSVVELLDTILRSTEESHDKKAAMMPALG